MILVDASIWIDHRHATDERLAEGTAGLLSRWSVPVPNPSQGCSFHSNV